MTPLSADAPSWLTLLQPPRERRAATGALAVPPRQRRDLRVFEDGRAIRHLTVGGNAQQIVGFAELLVVQGARLLLARPFDPEHRPRAGTAGSPRSLQARDNRVGKPDRLLQSDHTQAHSRLGLVEATGVGPELVIGIAGDFRIAQDLDQGDCTARLARPRLAPTAPDQSPVTTLDAPKPSGAPSGFAGLSERVADPVPVGIGEERPQSPRPRLRSGPAALAVAQQIGRLQPRSRRHRIDLAQPSSAQFGPQVRIDGSRIGGRAIEPTYS